MDDYLGNQYEDRQLARSWDQRESSQYANPLDAYSQPIGFQCYDADSQDRYSHYQHVQTQQPRYRVVSDATWDAAPTRMSYNISSASNDVFSSPTPMLGAGSQYQLMRQSQSGQMTTNENGYRAEQRTPSWQ